MMPGNSGKGVFEYDKDKIFKPNDPILATRLGSSRSNCLC